jgi:ThiF family
MNLVLVGAGNIGSFAVDLFARDPKITGLSIVDRDTHTAENLPVQNIGSADIGRDKAHVAARRAQRIAGKRLKVEAYPADLAALPWALYRRADVVVSCLDSQPARIQLATICWRMGRPLLDCGVNASADLARVTWFVPGKAVACYMCTIPDWSRIDGTFSCAQMSANPTGAPAYLGALAAALALARLDDRQGELVFNPRHAKALTSRHVRNPACPFDHSTWKVQPVALDPFVTTWGSLFKRHKASRVSVAGDMIVSELICGGCGTKRSNLLALRHRSRARRCGRCGGALLAPGSATHEWIETARIPEGLRNQKLASAGIAVGDILTFDEATHYEIQARTA